MDDTTTTTKPKRRYQPVPQWRREVPKGTIGTVHEMLVAYDLLKKGWHVFRSASLATPYKLIAVKEKYQREEDGSITIVESIMLKVEVTTGHRFGEYLNHPKKTAGPWDLLAIVVADDEIIYQPWLPHD